MKKAWWLALVAVMSGLMLISGCSCGGGEETPAAETAGGVAQLTGSENFTVTDCKKNGNSYTVTVNKGLVIANINLDGEEVKLPAYEPRTGAPKPYLEAAGADGETLLKDIEAAVRAVKDGGSVPASDKTFTPFAFGGIEVSIIQPRATDGGSRGSSSSRSNRGERAMVKARQTNSEEGGSSASGSSRPGGSSSATRPPTVLAELVLNDGLKVTGLRIMPSRSGGGYWISWPSKKVGSRYVPSVTLTDNETRKKIELALLAAYAEKAGLDPATVTLSQRGGGEEGGEEGGSPAGDIFISEIKKDGDNFTATLWADLVIKGISIGEGVEFPASQGRAREGQEARSFPFVKAPYQTAATALDTLKKAIEAFAENGEWEKGASGALEITGVRVRSGYAAVTFNNAIQIDSFRIKAQGEDITVSLPALKKGSDWVEVISFRNAATWKKIQERIADEYRANPPRARNSGSNRSGSSSRRGSDGGNEE